MTVELHFEGGVRAVYNSVEEALAQAGYEEGNGLRRAERVVDPETRAERAGRTEIAAAAAAERKRQQDR